MKNRVSILALVLGITLSLSGAAMAADVTVFAAASLADAMKELTVAFNKQTGKTAVASLAASSALARQIESSGGADIFISADLDWMDYLDQRGLVLSDSRVNLLGNRLVLVAAKDVNTQITIAPHFDLAGALKGGRLSIADPDSVPAGKYGRTSLISLGVWNGVVNHLVNAENVRVALSYVARGEAPLGIVYETDAQAEANVRVVGVFPENSHQPILYPAALVKNPNMAPSADARAFLAFLSSPTAKTVFEKLGFTVLSK